MKKNIGSEWSRVREYLVPSIDMSLGVHTEDSVLTNLLSGKYMLVAGERSAMVLTTDQGAVKTLDGLFAGGDLAEIQTMVPVIEKMAWESGFERVILTGRRGWVRAFDGYKELCVTMYKDRPHG